MNPSDHSEYDDPDHRRHGCTHSDRAPRRAAADDKRDHDTHRRYESHTMTEVSRTTRTVLGVELDGPLTVLEQADMVIAHGPTTGTLRFIQVMSAEAASFRVPKTIRCADERSVSLRIAHFLHAEPGRPPRCSIGVPHRV
jgi:hypothetical protein